MAARIECDIGNHDYFIPINEQVALINEQSVTALLDDSDKDIARRICEGSRTLFATLLLIRRPSDILNFLEEGVYDKHLPFTRIKNNLEFELNLQSGKPAQSTQGWDWSDREYFERYQWWMLAPVFEDLEHYDLYEKVLLPFTSLGDARIKIRGGGWSEVYQARVHPAHHKWSAVNNLESSGPLVAVKRLYESSEEEFKKEQSILRRLGAKNHPHLIKLLSTFRQGGKWNLIFPFADCNLRTYWDSHPIPAFEVETIKWTLDQIIGLASAIYHIHDFRLEYRQKDVSVAGLTLRVQEQERVYGRHGDLKPENILWFKESPNINARGILQITDFGLGRFHGRVSRSNVNPSSVYASPTYEAPELKLSRPVSRAYDMWSLGCVFLEFLTWLLMGAKAIEDFADCRGEPSNISDDGSITFSDDNFFTITDQGQGGKVRAGVITWVESLHAHENCSGLIHELLDCVMDGLIVIDASRRFKAGQLVRNLKSLKQKADSNEDFMMRPAPYQVEPPSPPDSPGSRPQFLLAQYY
ncbi:hypothetical protein ASPZODRAFT_130197 [Penicilliopsis zonata CBS 506.65]|uniref:Protein kinase domain-containing protein n=1 Tax=Penicilliopsis zonata CBS 506.65 TaxID=1073090 RepID=A0A1L9SMH5_9EURO|nr:hypothetical protein ASPZODRAFT_130197 [Penicilliopsis zonata CBS 506.65]OJJ48237.1 hypothetical protein ASPZODRAFT_130197 [Penicilliopsis zonata CBS 506.65]